MNHSLLLLIIAFAGAPARAADFEPYTLVALDGRPAAVAIGDVSGDGLEDIVVTQTFCLSAGVGNPCAVYVFRQRRDGKLEAPLRHRISHAAFLDGLTLADMNGDGRKDIVVGHDKGISILLTNPRNPFKPKRLDTTNSAQIDNVVSLDVDLDGNLDVISHGYMEGALIFYGDGAGSFVTTQPLATNGRQHDTDVKIADLNNDGFPDLAVTYVDRLNVLLHDGVSGFNPVQSIDLGFGGWTAAGLALADFNGDGLVDIATGKHANSPTHLSVFYQQNGGGYSDQMQIATRDLPRALATADLNNDSRPDLIVAHAGFFSIGYLLQSSSGLEPESFLASPVSTDMDGLAVGDLNGDGCVDIASVQGQIGLAISYNSGCHPDGDLAVGISAGQSDAAIVLRNISNAQALPETLLEVSISTQNAAIDLAGAPPNCVVRKAGMSNTHFECVGDPLAPQASQKFDFSYVLTPQRAQKQQLPSATISATAETGIIERTLDNNFTSQTVILP